MGRGKKDALSWSPYVFASGHSMDRERGVSVAEYGVTPLSHPAVFDSGKKLFVSLWGILGKDTDPCWVSQTLVRLPADPLKFPC